MDFKEKLHCSVKTICQSCGKVIPPQESKPSDTAFFLPFSTLCSCSRANLIPAPQVSQAIQYSKDVFVRKDFELVEALGSGTLADAYRVKSKSLDKDFVIKILNARLAENPRTAKRYRLAAAAALNLSHSNLAHVVESGINEDGASYVVSEYIDGQDLATVLQNEGFLDASDVIELGIQVLEALAHAHENNVMHRGVKPSNIYLTERKQGRFTVRLADIGIARAWPSAGRETRFELLDGSEFGDPRYMSPEQCSGHTFKPCSDVYSLGCVLYEAVSGKTPFASGSRTKIAIKQLTEDIRPLNDRFRDLDIPVDLEAVIMKALAKESQDRYQSAQEMLEDLQKVGKPIGPNAAKKPKEGILPKLLRITKGQSLFAAVGLAFVLTSAFVASHAVAPQAVSPFAMAPHAKVSLAEPNTKVSLTVPSPTRALSPVESLPMFYAIKPHMKNADLHSAACQYWDLANNRFSSCDLTNAHFNSADLSSATFQSVKMRDADLGSANLSHAELVGSDLSAVSLCNADLSNAQLLSVDLRDADLRYADLSHAKLNSVDLRGANLLGCTLPDDISHVKFR
jgi:serine/threonine protein kinase